MTKTQFQGRPQNIYFSSQIAYYSYDTVTYLLNYLFLFLFFLPALALLTVPRFLFT